MCHLGRGTAVLDAARHRQRVGRLMGAHRMWSAGAQLFFNQPLLRIGILWPHIAIHYFLWAKGLMKKSRPAGPKRKKLKAHALGASWINTTAELDCTLNADSKDDVSGLQPTLAPRFCHFGILGGLVLQKTPVVSCQKGLSLQRKKATRSILGAFQPKRVNRGQAGHTLLGACPGWKGIGLDAAAMPGTYAAAG